MNLVDNDHDDNGNEDEDEDEDDVKITIRSIDFFGIVVSISVLNLESIYHHHHHYTIIDTKRLVIS